MSQEHVFSFENKSVVLDKSLGEQKAVNITINGKVVQVPNGITVIQACELFNVEIPRFCYHDRLKVAGNCRMCLVEIQPGPPKPQASCAINVAEGMVIKTDSAMVKKAREGVMEFLLANHPLDCPICDQGGECDLQDQAFKYGSGTSRFEPEKRAVEDKNMGPLVKTQMTRCVHCTRCVRFMEDIAGTSEIGAFNRGNDVEVATYLNRGIKSELSGNIIDLCPVGALTSKPFAFKARNWEMQKTYSVDIMDAVGSNICIHHKANEVLRISPSINEDINEEWISDKTRFAYDGLALQRLDSFYVKSFGKLAKTSKNDCFEAIKKQFNLLQNPSEQFAILLGDVVDNQTASQAVNFAKQIGCQIACNQDGANINTASRANYIFNDGLAAIEEADVILLVGTNPRLEAAVANIRIRKAAVENKAQIFVVGQKCDLNYPFTHLGDEKSILGEILNGSHAICEQIKSAKKPMLIIGQDAINDEDGLEIHNTSMQIADKLFARPQINHVGFNMLHKVAGRVGSLDAGANQNTYKQIISLAKSGKIKMLLCLGVDETELKFDDVFVVYAGSHGDFGVNFANAIIPATTYTEKSAQYTNTQGLIQCTMQAIATLGEAMDEAEIVKYFKQTFAGKNTGANTSNLCNNDGLKYQAIIVALKGKFTLKMKSFYQTCAISRSSATMAKCIQEGNRPLP